MRSKSSKWDLEVSVFVEGQKPENPGKNPRTKDENQHMASTSGIKPRPHWWVASGLTTAPYPCSPYSSQSSFLSVRAAEMEILCKWHGVQPNHLIVMEKNWQYLRWSSACSEKFAVDRHVPFAFQLVRKMKSAYGTFSDLNLDLLPTHLTSY